jgi:deoxyribodipyrimidine photo-lyase
MLDSVLVWFRRDLRDHDRTALTDALRRAGQVYCAFIFDHEILDALPSRADRRVEFVRESLVELDASLRRRGGGLILQHALASQEVPRLAKELGIAAVFCNRDYEPQAKLRDARVGAALNEIGIDFESFKDQALFDGAVVLT